MNTSIKTTLPKIKKQDKLITNDVMCLIEGMNKQLKLLTKVITNMYSSNDNSIRLEKKIKIL